MLCDRPTTKAGGRGAADSGVAMPFACAVGPGSKYEVRLHRTAVSGLALHNAPNPHYPFPFPALLIWHHPDPIGCYQALGLNPSRENRAAKLASDNKGKPREVNRRFKFPLCSVCMGERGARTFALLGKTELCVSCVCSHVTVAQNNDFLSKHKQWLARLNKERQRRAMDENEQIHVLSLASLSSSSPPPPPFALSPRHLQPSAQQPSFLPLLSQTPQALPRLPLPPPPRADLLGRARVDGGGEDEEV
eukprot:1512196-Rhodomonas_salina.3